MWLCLRPWGRGEWAVGCRLLGVPGRNLLQRLRQDRPEPLASLDQESHIERGRGRSYPRGERVGGHARVGMRRRGVFSFSQLIQVLFRPTWNAGAYPTEIRNGVNEQMSQASGTAARGVEQEGQSAWIFVLDPVVVETEASEVVAAAT